MPDEDNRQEVFLKNNIHPNQEKNDYVDMATSEVE